MFLVTVHEPVCTEHGDLHAALYGSFLPVPSSDVFPAVDWAPYATNKAPGAIVVKDEDIILNQGRDRIELKVTNNGDRPIQVRAAVNMRLFVHLTQSVPQIGSHYHFIETNKALSFDRAQAYGKRLDIAAGTAVRFEPGDVKTVKLVAIGGRKVISGGNRLASGPFDPSRTQDIIDNLLRLGFLHVPQPNVVVPVGDTTITRNAYVAMFGPTVGDRVRLGDSALWIEVEKDLVSD